ncbi:hypothetical protein N9Y82_04605 [Amylibacter sp.]|nr:hypothetical protein [Amylibacter sp.]
MKLNLLLKRENFEDIFSKTLAKYLSSKKGWYGKIEWGLFNDGALNLVVNEHINLMFPAKISSKEIRFLAKEYEYHPNILIRVMQFSYVYVCLNYFLRNIFASNTLSITPEPTNFSHICILPGNHSIRVVDLHANECVVLSKSGYGLTKIKNTIFLRTDFPNIPGPKILDYDFDEGWYVEQRIFGLPLNRQSDNTLKFKSLEAAKVYLCSMYDSTQKFVALEGWLTLKLQQMKRAATLLPECYGVDTRKKLDGIILQLSIFSSRYVGADELIEICVTHGDFQDANVLIPFESEGVYIIDWEYGGERCRHYDAFVYNLNSRSPKGLGDRVDNLYKQSSDIERFKAWCGLASQNKRSCNNDNYMLLVSFLFDEMLFRLDDTSVPYLNEPSAGFLTFMDEITKIFVLIDDSLR